MKTKAEPMVNLSVNPCKMCMPMGAVTALYGIKKCMSILHGSQGCSTYIRRHMATHYNEPVDIASSSLTEEGTVYGGEENLLKGLKNLISLYRPEVIGVLTTCLSETIGEDIERMIHKFYEENPQYKDMTILPIHSAGYGGTHFDGYCNALYQIITNVKMDITKHKKVNVVTGMLSPGDIRFLKEAFEDFGITPIFISDISKNLDGIFNKKYKRLPSYGTSIEEIKTMAGAQITLEMLGVYREKSVGDYLEKMYGVPCRRINIPCGIRDTDAFYQVLSEISQKPIPKKIKEKRGRYLDAMIDGHKYNGEGRAAIFGDPDFVLSVVRLCRENGIMPLIAATGSCCNQLRGLLEEEMKEIAEKYLIDKFLILDNVDFKDIEAAVIELNANIMIGNSDGRRIEHELEISLVRRGFPIHDRVGGQRLLMLGYEGSLCLLDEISNTMLSKKESNFRQEIYDKYFVEEQKEIKEDKKEEMNNILEKTKNHPCYNCGAHDYARMHLPIAPACNIQCNYCVRKFDCPNESRPGVTTKVLTPEEAFEKYKYVKERVPNLSVVGIAGPGDALANFTETKKTFELIREYDPDVTFCLSTNGLLLPKYADELIRLGVSHVTVTCNAVDPKIAGVIYKHIDYMGMRFTGESAGAILLSNQLNGLRLLVSKGIICKINIVTLKGINDKHIPEIVKKMKEIGCYITNIMPLIPVKGSVFENNEVASNKEVDKIRKMCGQTMKQMYHCKQCRADAIGQLDSDISIEFSKCQGGCNTEKEETVYRFAVTSRSGMIVDQHFGQVKEIYIYEYKNNEVFYIEKRQIQQYCTGSEFCDEHDDKIERIIQTMKDCQGVIAMRIGQSPKEKLEERGIQIFTTYNHIIEAVQEFAQQLNKNKKTL